MARQKLTAGRIRDFKNPKKGQTFLWDTEVPGLGIRATIGSKVFIYQGRLDGKSIRIKIGDVRTWAIDSIDPKIPGARQEARRLQSLIDQGFDPRMVKLDRLEKQEAKRVEASRHEATLADAWQSYIDDRKHLWTDRHCADHYSIAQAGGEKAKIGKAKTKPGPLASLMGLKLSDLTPETVKAWAILETKKRPGSARLAFSLLRACLNWCEQMPEYAGLASPAACGTAIKRDYIPKQRPRKDCLQKEQLSAWFGAVRGLSNPVMAAYLQALLLIGCRREELAGLKWEDVDFRWQGLTIHDKVEGFRTIPLTPYVAALLDGLPRRNQWVFSSPTSAAGRLKEPRIPHNKALAVAGIEHLTLHGLRRSFGTLSEWVEVPAGIVAQLMGHKPSATAEKHYRQRPLDLLRMWHTKIEKWILDQAGIEQPENGNGRLKLVKTNERMHDGF
jgi:integrase